MRRHYMVFMAVVMMVLFSTIVVPTRAETITKNFTLKHFDVTLTFPETANSGDSILISITAEARSSIRVRDLSIQILAYMEGGDLQSIGSTSLTTDQYVYKGNKLHKEFSITIASSIPRGALVSVVSETTRSTTYSYYSYYPYYYGYYPYYYGSDSTPYWYYPYYYGYYYPETYSQEYIESKALPGTYVMAPTPEYVQLKGEYDKLSSDYQQLSSQYNEVQVKYQQATEQNRELSNQLSTSNQNLNYATILAIVFLATTIIMAVFAGYLSRKKTVVMTPVTTSIASAPAASAPAVSEPEKVKPAPQKKEVPKKTIED